MSSSIAGPSEFDINDSAPSRVTSAPTVVLLDPALEESLGETARAFYSKELSDLGLLPEFDSTQMRTFGPLEQPADSIGDINSTTRGSGARYNGGKVPLDLIPLSFLANELRLRNAPKTTAGVQALGALSYLGEFQVTGEALYLYSALRELGDGWDECARVFDYGRKKYAEWNWAKGMPWSVPLACAARHLRQIIDGEDMDEESGRLHVGHVYCNIVMLLQYQKTYKDGDNLPRLLRPAVELQQEGIA